MPVSRRWLPRFERETTMSHTVKNTRKPSDRKIRSVGPKFAAKPRHSWAFDPSLESAPLTKLSSDMPSEQWVREQEAK